MSELTLVQKIKDDAAATVAEIKSAGNTQVEEIQREAKETIKTLQSEHETALQKELSHLELVALSKAKQASKIAVQKAKRDEINALFDEVIDEYAGLSGDDYIKLFTNHAKNILPEEVKITEVYSAPKKETEAAAVAKEFGFSGEVKTNPDIKAGLVVETDNGVYDITLDRIVGDKRAEIEMQIMQQVNS